MKRSTEWRDRMPSESLAEVIFEEIVADIITRKLSPGDKLVEKHYADKFGTSRAPVREAIYLLTKEGLVERIPRRGAVVRDFSLNDLTDLLAIRNTFEEMALARLDFSEVKQQELRDLKALVIKMKTEDVYTYTQLNYEFHFQLVKLSRSKPLIDLYPRLAGQLLRVQYLSFAQPGNMKKSLNEHEEILKLLEQKKKYELTKLMNSHNTYVISSVRQIFENLDQEKNKRTE